MLKYANESGKTTYLRVKEGYFVTKNENGEEIKVYQIGGSLRSITLKEHEVQEKKFKNWHVVIKDKGTGERYDVSFPRSSGAFKGVVRCLVTEQGMANLDSIVLEVYKAKNGYTNAKVVAGGEKLRWTEEVMPPVEETTFRGEKQYDDTKQIEWIGQLVDRINARIESDSEPTHEYTETEYDGEDMPE